MPETLVMGPASAAVADRRPQWPRPVPEPAADAGPKRQGTPSCTTRVGPAPARRPGGDEEMAGLPEAGCAAQQRPPAFSLHGLDGGRLVEAEAGIPGQLPEQLAGPFDELIRLSGHFTTLVVAALDGVIHAYGADTFLDEYFFHLSIPPS